MTAAVATWRRRGEPCPAGRAGGHSATTTLVDKGESATTLDGAPWTAGAELVCLFGHLPMPMRAVVMELLHTPIALPLLVLPHAFRQTRLHVQERPRGAFRRKL